MKRALSLILVVCMLVTLFSVVFATPIGAVSHAQTERDSGLNFSDYTANSTGYGADYYETTKHLEEVPHTFEAWVYITSSMRKATVGSIFGSSGKAGGSFNFCITKDFYPQLLFYDSGSNATLKNSASTHNATFKEAPIAPATWTHIVITIDESVGTLSCYINGELKQTIAVEDTCQKKCGDGCVGLTNLTWMSKFPFAFGGTMEMMNPMYFRGWLQDAAMYSDALTADEVKANYKNGIDPHDENLICYYDVDASDKGKNIKDESGNGYDLFYSSVWLTEEEMQSIRDERGYDGEYDYSIAVLGDIQYMTKSNPEDLYTMFEWIAANKDAKNIQYAIGLGDITDQCQEEEWITAQTAYKILEDAGIEYSLVRGNHDVATVGGIEESSRPTAKPELYDAIFGAEGAYYRELIEQHGGFYNDASVINTYRELTIGDDNWLIVNLDFQADESIRAWANEVIESYPSHRVIIVTHEYVGAYGTPSAYGKKLWADVASKHSNVELVLSGHVTCDNIKVCVSEGDNGNTVTQMLIDAQYIDRALSGLGTVTMFYFREGGTVIDIEHYSTVKQRYFKNINQITVDLKAESEVPAVVWDGVSSQAPIGEGTEEDPYLISSAANLLWMAEAHFTLDENGAVIAPEGVVNPFEGKYFLQTCDINLSAKTLYTIGYYFESESVGAYFGGSYDANGYSIYNGKIVNPYSDAVSAGLFAETAGATVSNLTLREIAVEAKVNSGFVIGRANLFGNAVINCESAVSCKFKFDESTEKMNVGAMVGLASNLKAIGCKNKANIAVFGSANLGGIVGATNGESLVYDLKNDGSLSVVNGGSCAQLVGEANGTLILAAISNKKDFKAYNAGDCLSIHNVKNFVKSGDASHTAKCACGDDIILPCATNGEGYCKYCEIDITGASLTLGETVSINYFVTVKDPSVIEGKTLTMQFTTNSGTVTVSDYIIVNGKLVFALNRISVHQIAELIDAKLIATDSEGEKTIASKLDYSVKAYCKALLVESEEEEVIKTVSAFLEYVNKLQAYTDYGTENFAAGGILLETNDELPTEEDKTVVLGNKNANCNVTKNYAYYDGEVVLRAEIYIADLSLAEIIVNGAVYDKTKLIALENSVYAIEISGFEYLTVNDEADICVLYNGKQSARFSLSVPAYVYSMIEDKKQIEADKEAYRPTTKTVDEAEYQFFLAAYRYGKALESYFGFAEEAAK